MHNLLPQTVFYIFALIASICAFFVVTQNNPVRCVLFLVSTFITMAILWILADAEFLALILVLVYVGAVMTLFLFVVMMLNIDVESLKGHLARALLVGMGIVTLFTGLLISVVSHMGSLHPAGKPAFTMLTNTEKLGMVLYTDYVYAFELAAAILLVSIIAAITLVHRSQQRPNKRQKIGSQINTTAAQRCTLISMKAENEHDCA